MIYQHFLKDVIDKAAYDRWLSRKSRAHLKRDRSRGNSDSTNEHYKIAIHQAVVICNGLDSYTGKPLRWDLLSKYDNAESKSSGRAYKAKFADLPTVDHVNDGLGKPEFKICSWRVNDAKNDLSLDDFLVLCDSILSYNRRQH